MNIYKKFCNFRDKMLKCVKFFLKLLYLLPFVLLFHLLIFLFLTVLILPCAIYRKILFYLTPFVKPKFGKMLNLPATLLYTTHKNPMGSEILCQLKVNGDINLNQIRSEFKSKILDLRNSNGQLVYPEFRQYLQIWMGHLFWKDCKDFTLDHHILYWTKSKEIIQVQDSNEEIFRKINLIRKEILLDQFPLGKSQWVVYFISDPKNQSTHCFFKFHHSIGDGFSMLKMLSNAISTEKIPEIPKTTRKISKSSIFAQLFHLIIKILNTPFIFTENILQTKSNESEWQKSINDQDFLLKSHQVPIGQSKLISFKQIKEIASNHGVNESTVVLGAICGGIRNFMLKNDCKIPKNLVFGTPFPRPNHPDSKLRNNTYMLTFPLPISDENPFTRLEKIYKRIKAIKKRTFLFQYLYLIAITFCTLPYKLNLLLIRTFLRGGNNSFPLTFVYTGLPKPTYKYVYVNDQNPGQSVNLVGFLCPAFICGLPLFLSSTSTLEGLKFYATGTESVFKSDKEIQDFLRMIENEFDILSNYKIDQVV